MIMSSCHLKILNQALLSIKRRAIFKIKMDQNPDMELTEKVKFYDDSSNHIIDENNPKLIEVMHQMLGKCVLHHNAIINLIDELEAQYSFVILAQFASSCSMLCLLLFQASSNPVGSPIFLSSSLYYWVMMYQLLIYCWYGNEVTLQVCFCLKFYFVLFYFNFFLTIVYNG